jgi:hypothetical protein
MGMRDDESTQHEEEASYQAGAWQEAPIGSTMAC